MVHGCIDGFSRCIVLLRCSNNNKSSTVFGLFLSAIHEFGLPTRVRSDCGGGNVKVHVCILHVSNNNCCLLLSNQNV